MEDGEYQEIERERRNEGINWRASRILGHSRHMSFPKIPKKKLRGQTPGNLLRLNMLFAIGSICLVACKSPPLGLVERVKVSHRQSIPTIDSISGQWEGIDLRFANQAFLFFDNDWRGYWKYDWFESPPIIENFEWSIEEKEIRLTADGGSGMLWNCAWLEVWQAGEQEKIIMTGFYPDGSITFIFNKVASGVPLSGQTPAGIKGTDPGFRP